MSGAQADLVASQAIFVGIPVTYQSLIVGIQSQQRLRASMKTFRELNNQQRQSTWLPDELVCQIESYLRDEAYQHGLDELHSLEESDKKHEEQDLQDSQDSQNHEGQTHESTISGFLESTGNNFLQQNYSLAVKVTQNTPKLLNCFVKKAYLCIPWKSTIFHPDTGKETWKVCKENGYSNSISNRWCEEVWKQRTSGDTIVEQDLSVTAEKVSAINKAIRELNLVIPKYKRKDYTWQAATDAPEGVYSIDEQWPSAYSAENGKLWIPKVLMIQQTSLEV